MERHTHCALLVVGGGPTGQAALASYRDHGGPEPVVLVSEDDELPYRRPPLSKDFLRGETGEQELLLAERDWYEGIDVRLTTAVVGLDARQRTAILHNGQTIGYDTCLLATGSRPVPLPVPGGDRPEVL